MPRVRVQPLTARALDASPDLEHTIETSLNGPETPSSGEDDSCFSIEQRIFGGPRVRLRSLIASSPDKTCFVAYDPRSCAPSNYAGIVCATRRGAHVYVHTLCTIGCARNGGVATALLAAAEAFDDSCDVHISVVTARTYDAMRPLADSESSRIRERIDARSARLIETYTSRMYAQALPHSSSVTELRLKATR